VIGLGAAPIYPSTSSLVAENSTKESYGLAMGFLARLEA
jgi:MFS family permease